MPTSELASNRSYAEIRKARQAAKLHSLWESAVAHELHDGGPTPNQFILYQNYFGCFVTHAKSFLVMRRRIFER